MSDWFGWSLVAILYLAWFLDIASSSDARDRLVAQSQALEAAEVVEWAEQLGLDPHDIEDLTVVRVIRLRRVVQRLVFALTPGAACRLLKAK